MTPMAAVKVSKYDVDPELTDPNNSHTLLVEMAGSNKRVLDVGCSTGYLSRILVGRGNQVSGVEYDAAAAEEARQFLAKLVVGDLESLDLVAEFGEATFDVVVFGDVLEHLRDPLPVLRQARRLLAPGGSVLLSIPNIAHGDVRMALLLGRFQYRNLGLLDETHIRFFTRESLSGFLHDAGFTPVDIRRTTAPLFHTEIGVREDEVDPAVVAQLRQDPEAETYQFVVRAAPDDAVQAAEEVALRAEQQERRLHFLESEVARLREALAAAQEAAARAAAQRDELAERVTRAERTAAEATADANRARQEFEALMNTRVFKAAQVPRSAYAALRRYRAGQE